MKNVLLMNFVVFSFERTLKKLLLKIEDVQGMTELWIGYLRKNIESEGIIIFTAECTHNKGEGEVYLVVLSSELYYENYPAVSSD
jgi:hypothetical protein